MFQRIKSFSSRSVQVTCVGGVLAMSLSLGVTGCSDRSAQNVGESRDASIEVLPQGQLTANHLTVLDSDGRSIAGATIQIGLKPGVPFAGNTIVTDASGVVALPAAWTDEQPVTIEAAGFVRATYFAQTPRSAQFRLRRASAAQPLQLQGSTTNFGQMVRNGTLDVSLVFPAVKRSQVSSMELTQLIGTGVDRVNVLTETLSLPANLSIPAQSETLFGIIPVSIDKPTYRTMVPTAGNHRFAAVHVQFDFKKTVEDLRAGKSFFDIINRLDFQSFTTRDFAITQPAQAANLPLGENQLRPTLSVHATGVPAGYTMVATALTDKGGLCVVTDVKRLLEGERSILKAADAAAGDAVLIRTLKKYDASRTDFSTSDYEESSAIATLASQPVRAGFLPLIKPLTTQARLLIFTKPILPAGLTAGLTQVTLSKTVISSAGDLKLIEKSPVWDLYVSGFADSMELPSVGQDVWKAAGRYRWELKFAAAEAALPTPLSSDAIGAATHVTKAAVDFVVR